MVPLSLKDYDEQETGLGEGIAQQRVASSSGTRKEGLDHMVKETEKDPHHYSRRERMISSRLRGYIIPVHQQDIKERQVQEERTA